MGATIEHEAAKGRRGRRPRRLLARDRTRVLRGLRAHWVGADAVFRGYRPGAPVTARAFCRVARHYLLLAGDPDDLGQLWRVDRSAQTHGVPDPAEQTVPGGNSAACLNEPQYDSDCRRNRRRVAAESASRHRERALRHIGRRRVCADERPSHLRHQKLDGTRVPAFPFQGGFLSPVHHDRASAAFAHAGQRKKHPGLYCVSRRRRSSGHGRPSRI
jgi:hypothetical protein